MLTSVRHRELYVEVHSNQDAEHDATLFFIHGSMASLSQFRFQIEFFSSKFKKIVAYDYFGCGKSPKLPDSWESYSTEEHMKDLIFLFDLHKTTANFLIGHSYGTNQVVRLALEPKFHKYIFGVVMISYAIIKDGGHPLFFLPEFILNWIQPKLSQGFLNMALHPLTRDKKTPAHVILMQECIARSNSNSMHVAKSFYRQMKSVKEEDVRNNFPSNTQILLLCGDSDPLTPIEMARTFASWITNGESRIRLEVIGPAAHQVMEEQPEETNRAMNEFFIQTLKKAVIIANL
jgi:pimeloyl-ACP methyl ester carboxylesterase